MLEKLLKIFSTINNHLNCEDAYQQYLQQKEVIKNSFCNHHHHLKTLNRKEFFKLYHHKKWQKINRCC